MVRFPDGGTQYWLTTREFSEGDVIGEDGRRWVVTDTAPPGLTDTHLTVTVREAD
jgi:hypothetical protein